MKTTTPVFKSRRQQKLWEKEKKRIEARKSKSYVNHAPFRYVERNFKSRVSAPDFTDVVDFQNRDRNTQANNDNIVHVDLKDDLKNLSSLFGSLEDHPSSRDAYVLKNVPGLIIIPNAFSPKAQRQLVKQCLSIYPQPPNTSNLDTHYIIPSTGLWPLYKAQEEGVLTPNDPGFFVPKKEVQSETSDTYVDSEEEEDVKSKAHQAKDLGPKAPPTACSDDFKPVMKEEKPDPLPAPGVPLLPPNELVRKLRWVTLGYQYHWPTKTYHLDRQYPFPEDVSELTKAVVTAI
ncbi:Alpha-ketoglutarate-dependent dioxygenase alkB, partial [Choanephora cucurbitarum]